MKKSLQERLNASLDKALDPPRRRRPRQDLDALLEEYDDGQAAAAPKESAPVSSGIPEGIPAGIPSGIPDTSAEEPQTKQRQKLTAAPAKQRPQAPAPKPAEEASKEAGSEIFVSLDATHTTSEKIIYSHMYRETVRKGRAEGYFGPALLMKLSGIRSRNTIHKALYGLIEKLSVERVGEASSRFGPRYRVYGPQEILNRRKTVGMVIDTQTKKITERADGIPAGIPVSIPAGIPASIPRYPKIWDSGIPNFGILLNREIIESATRPAEGSSSSILGGNDDDDEAFAGFVRTMREAAEEVTGRRPSGADERRWTELAELLATELKLAAGRTTVSSVPAFLAEHLRRRLWKRDKRELEAEAGPGPKNAPEGKYGPTAGHPAACPDCFGTGMFYPDGFDKGVAKCRHERLGQESTPSEG